MAGWPRSSASSATGSTRRTWTNGVTFVDPNATYIDVDVTIGRDTVIRPMTFLEGETRIGAGATVGPSSRIVDSRWATGAR